MRPNRHRVSLEQARVAKPLENWDVDLCIRFQVNMARKLEIGKEREQDQAQPGALRDPAHGAGVLSNCCFAHTRCGFSLMDVASASRASAFRFALRSAMPIQR